MKSAWSSNCTMLTWHCANTPWLCSSLALSLLITGPRLTNSATLSNFSLGMVPVRPQRMGIRLMTPVSKVFNASALAMCTSSTITHTTPSINSPMVQSSSVVPFFVFFNNTFRLCQVQMVCWRPHSLRSPKYTPTSRPMLM